MAEQRVFNDSLRREREARGWSQTKLAEMLDTNVFTVSRWERGYASPGLYYRKRLCDVFEMSAEELGLLPGPAPTADEQGTTAAASTILAYAAPPLPPFGATLVGRDGILAALRGYLIAHQHAAIAGLPGVGKTSLAMAAASDEAIRNRFPGGVLWAGLGPSPHIQAILGGWAATLGVAAQESDPIELLGKRIRSAIGSRALLLVIDDAWRIADALAFKIGGPQCGYILTTRAPDLAAQFAQEGFIHLEELTTAEGVALLAEFIPEIVEQESEQTRQLVQAVGGLPLALTLMGRYIARQAISGNARRIQAALALLQQAEQRLHLAETIPTLARPPALSTDTPLSLHAVIAIGYQHLSDDMQRMLAHLALLPAKPNTFSEEAALAISGTPAALEHLDVLQDSGFVIGQAPDRYTIHQTIVDYLRLSLPDALAERRLVRFFTDYAGAHQADYPQLDCELENILAAFAIAMQRQEGETAATCIIALTPFLLARGLHALARTHLQTVYEQAFSHLSPLLQCHLLLALAQTALHSATYAEVEGHTHMGITLAKDLALPSTLASFLIVLGNAEWKNGDLDRAQTRIEEAIHYAQQAGDKKQLSQALQVLGSILETRGDDMAAEQHYQAALSHAYEIGDDEQHIALLQSLGVLMGKRGKYLESIHLFEEALALSRARNYPQAICSLMIKLSISLANCGKYAESEIYVREALPIAERLGNIELACSALRNLGVALCRQDRATEGIVILQTCLARAREINNLSQMGTALTVLASQFTAMNNLNGAAPYLEEAIALARKQNDQFLLPYLHHELARLRLYEGETDAAIHVVQASLEMAQAVHAQDLYARSVYLKSLILMAQDHVPEALACGRESIQLLSGIQSGMLDEASVWVEGLTHYQQARERAGQGDYRGAREDAQRSISLLETQGDALAQECQRIRQWMATLP